MAGLDFLELIFGTFNNLRDLTSINSGSRRRGDSVSYANSALQMAFSKDTLSNKKQFYGIVINNRDMSGAPYAKRGPLLTDFALSTDTNNPSGTGYKTYKVYVPELECRPYPLDAADPVIYTYPDVYLSSELEEKIGTDAQIPLGAIVVIEYDNLTTLKDPLIVAYEGETMIEWEGAGQSAAALWATSNTGQVGGGGRRTSGSLDPAPSGPIGERPVSGRALVIGDSMSRRSGPGGGFGHRIAMMLKDRGYTLRPEYEKNKPAGIHSELESGEKHPEGVATYPGMGTMFFIKKSSPGIRQGDSDGYGAYAKDSLEPILKDWRPTLLIVELGANDASLGLPEGVGFLRGGKRNKYIECMDANLKEDNHEELSQLMRTNPAKDRRCREEAGLRGKGPLAPRERDYKLQLESFVTIAREQGVQHIIWIGPTYMTRNYAKDGISQLEKGAENIRSWQKEVFARLGVEWHDAKPMTENISDRRSHDGLHFRGAGYEEWAKAAEQVIF